MKKFFKFFAIAVLIIVTGIFSYAYISFNYYDPGDPEVNVDEAKLAYFQDTWGDCKNAFLEQAQKLKENFDSVEIFSIPIESNTDYDLTIDFCYIPPGDTATKLMVINSGIHGIEGYTGSAIQQMLLAEFLEPEMTSELGILFIHGMNAWGFKNKRRFSENNVDLNRNYSINRDLFKTKNDGFVALYDMLTPKGELNMNSIKNRFFIVTAIIKIIQEGLPALTQAFAQGQYQYPEGIYFGGKNFEQQVDIISKVYKEKTAAFETVLTLDLHTGFGERGILHLFPNPVEDPQLKQKIEAVFAGNKIDWPEESSNFYTISGQFGDFVGELLPDKTCIAMPLEFGTLNSSKIMGSIHSAFIPITENQGYHYGYKSEKDSIKAKEGLYDMFYPRSEKWRTNVINLSLEMFESVMENYSNL